LHEGSIKTEQHVEFLKALRTHLKQTLPIIWDGLTSVGSATSHTEQVANRI
jgi:hypothetical protein